MHSRLLQSKRPIYAWRWVPIFSKAQLDSFNGDLFGGFDRKMSVNLLTLAFNLSLYEQAFIVRAKKLDQEKELDDPTLLNLQILFKSTKVKHLKDLSCQIMETMPTSMFLRK
jgi:hypothetical protein